MKAKLFTLSLALLSTVIYSQTSVPDINFENYLETHDASGNVVSVGDVSSMGDGINGNGLVTTANIDSVTSLNVSFNNINSLEGIEDFIDLNVLICNNNNLMELNLALNTSLVLLFCQDNMLTNLTLPNTTSLVTLNCSNNQLPFLDISNITGLKILNCGNNLLTSIDLNNHPDLETLYIESNSLTELDASSNSILYDLNCSDNDITDLNILDLYYLTFLDCSQNLLPDLDISTNLQLFQLIISANNLTDFRPNSSFSLSFLDCSGNPNLTTLVLPSTLTSLNASFCNLSALIHPGGLPQIESLSLINDVFINLNVSAYLNLQLLACDNNQLTTLNLKNGNNVNFSFFSATGNNLTCITVDDVSYSNSNWTNIDPGVIYSTNCTLGLEEIDLSSISIYPNPSKDKFYIDLQTEANYTLSNVFGQEVKKGFFISGNNELETNTLSYGLYILNIETPDGKVTKKLIKQ